MSRFRNLKGQTFGRLTAVRRIGPNKGQAIWRFRCECGGRKETRGSYVVSGHVRSCGCLSNENRARISRKYTRTHGLGKTAEYKSYSSAKHRGLFDTRAAYANVGFSFKDFLEFYAELGPRPTPKHTLDRIRNTSDYAPGQCRWALPTEQAWNRRKSQGKYSSKYKGVSWKACVKRWTAIICKDGRNYYLGSFKNEEQAAKQYDDKARELFGPFACLNFPRKGESSALPIEIAA